MLKHWYNQLPTTPEKKRKTHVHVRTHTHTQKHAHTLKLFVDDDGNEFLFYVTIRGCRVWRKCILHHWVVQLILAYSWARPAIVVAGKGIEGNIFISSLSSLSFLFLFLPCPSLSSPVLSLLSFFSLSLEDDTK